MYLMMIINDLKDDQLRSKRERGDGGAGSGAVRREEAWSAAKLGARIFLSSLWPLAGGARCQNQEGRRLLAAPESL